MVYTLSEICNDHLLVVTVAMFLMVISDLILLKAGFYTYPRTGPLVFPVKVLIPAFLSEISRW